MSTAPFDPSVADLITGYHTSAVSAVATLAGLGEVPLVVTGGRIGWSERRAPMVTADLEVATPADAELVAALDPRLRPRVALTVTYVLANGDEDTHTVADLHLRRRAILRPASTMRLSLASDEALVIDSSPKTSTTEGGDGTEPQTFTTANGPAWIATIIRDGLWNLDYPTGPEIRITAPVAPAEWPEDPRDYWDSITDVADQLDLDVYDPGDRVFRIDPRPTVAAESVLSVKGGPGGILLDSSSTITRDEWANHIMLRYEWADSAGAQRVIYGEATVTGGPFAVGAVGYKIMAEHRDYPTAQYAATNAARTLLRRMLSRSRGLDVTTVPAWWVRPRQTITYQPENGDQQRHLVSEVEHDLTAMTMRLVTRLPDLDSTLGE